MKLIPLRDKDKQIIAHAKIDDEDYENVSKHTWRKAGNYAKSRIANIDVSMHHFIVGNPKKNFVVDHIYRDGLNNTRSNLRFATLGQNSQNKPKKEGYTSKYKGVTWFTTSKKWVTWSSNIYLGCFDNEEEAAKKYDTYVRGWQATPRPPS